MNQNDKTFNYTYSALQQEEIKQIRDKYAPPEEKEDKMEQLRRLDKSVTKPGTIVSIIIGTIGTLIFGFGLSCTMVWTDTLLVPGIIIGIVGGAGIVAAYPLFNCITKKQREKLAPEIVKLSDELMK